MTAQLQQDAARVASEYLGWEVKPSEVEVVLDPVVEHKVAVRVECGEVHFFLYDTREGADSVEEVEFTCWPPRQDKHHRRI